MDQWWCISKVCNVCVVAMLLCVFSCCFGLLVYNPKELDRVFRVYRVGF
jgi:hypothetical protein